MNPLVSIIIPCFNTEKYVAEAIESALAQTYPNCEVIVIDDGSTDRSLDVICSFGDRITWETGPNRGAPAARNRGAARARGDILQFLDADDTLYPAKLDLQVALLVRGAADLVACRISSFDTRSAQPNTGSDAAGACRKVDVLDYLARGGTLSCPGPILWRRDFFSVRGFRGHLPCCQEYDLHLRLAVRGATAVRLQQVLVNVRKVPGSISEDRVRLLEQRNQIRREIWQWLKDRDQMTDQRAAAFAAGAAHDGRAFLRRGMRDKADACFQLARKFHPGGGIDAAYGPLTRLLRYAVGPSLAEQLSSPFRMIRRRVREGIQATNRQ